MIVTVTLTMLYYDYTYLAIAPVQKVDNLYPLDDSAIGFTNTYYWSDIQRLNNRVMEPFLESARN